MFMLYMFRFFRFFVTLFDDVVERGEKKQIINLAMDPLKYVN